MANSVRHLKDYKLFQLVYANSKLDRQLGLYLSIPPFLLAWCNVRHFCPRQFNPYDLREKLLYVRSSIVMTYPIVSYSVLITFTMTRMLNMLTRLLQHLSGQLLWLSNWDDCVKHTLWNSKHAKKLGNKRTHNSTLFNQWAKH